MIGYIFVSDALSLSLSLFVLVFFAGGLFLLLSRAQNFKNISFFSQPSFANITWAAN